MTGARGVPRCPSAPARSDGAVVIGIAGPTGVTYLGRPLPVTTELLAAATRTGEPAEAVLRVAAPCAASRCRHFAAGSCSLVTRVVEQVDGDDDAALPPCGIRGECVWFAQERAAACRRCPRVRTWYAEPDARMRGVAVADADGVQPDR